MPSIFQRTIVCGKQSCKCQRGFQHGPYWYFVYYKPNATKPTMKYIGKDLKAPDGTPLNDKDEALAIWTQWLKYKTHDKTHDKIDPQEFVNRYFESDAKNDIEAGFPEEFLTSLKSDKNRPKMRKVLSTVLSYTK